ncbi:4-hydroxy-tetrahydrodipicolinate reductase [Microbacterium gorillae]|uniref:4-hydroxy-tetrahydrodipicolinate reductase n=1 Tax=Microbacterium gorillae TaxID=1231063 RepID=UPI00058D61E4|nr:4-hydroxy-tetrahydrodipicolinate reductase [Microbacterium gorillae]
MATRVALVGASGKLGGIIRRVVDDLDGFEVARTLGSRDSLDVIADVDLVIDASTPGASMDVVRTAAAAGVNALVATSGWSAERIAQVRPEVEAAGIGLVIIPNFSLGSVLGTALATIAGRFFDSVEIIESHRDTKIDSPSGTAVRTAELVAEARRTPVSAPHTDQRARGQQVAGIPVHSLRRPGVIARQEVLLSGPGETLSLVHDTVDSAAAYAPGIRIAVRAAVDASGIVVGLDHFIDLGLRASEAQA